ncbi:TPA: hypothetical protein ACOEMF_003046 [Enterobacter cloacae]
MSTITKEWLQQKIAEMEAARDEIPFGLDEDDSNTLAALRIALASLEAEAVAFRSKLKPSSAIGGEHWDYTEHRQPDAFELRNCIIERLYTAPPAPVSVPEPIKRNDADGWWMYKGRRVGGGCAEWYNLALDDCRAAMLQGADGNSPVFPDGWKLVPVELTGAMTNAMTDAILDDLHNVDVWRSVLAAAPQQEVK